MFGRFLQRNLLLNASFAPQLKEICATEIEIGWKLYQRHIQSSYGWRQIEEVGGIQVFSNFTDPRLIKRQGTVLAPPEEIYKFIREPVNWRKWNEVCSGCKFLQRFGDYNILEYTLSLTWPTLDRKLILAQGTRLTDNGGIAYILRSIQVEEQEASPSGQAEYIVLSAAPNSLYPEQSDVVYMSHIDLGSVPFQVEEQAINRRHKAILHIKKYLDN